MNIELKSTYLTPLQTIWMAMHNDYSEVPISEEIDRCAIPEEDTCGIIIVKRLLKGNRGHYGCLEHIPFVFYIEDASILDFAEFLYKPGIKVLQVMEGVYFKCNARSLLMLWDCLKVNPEECTHYQKLCISRMIELAEESIKPIHDWYADERVAFLTRTTQRNF